MPYIKTERRKYVEETLRPTNAGELNFLLSLIMRRYWVNSPHNYQILNDISGAMTESLAEFRRRIVSDYEDLKIKENGDIY